jgi:hypothetical protein
MLGGMKKKNAYHQYWYNAIRKEIWTKNIL